jgi:type I restriction enzyme S subunit
MSDNQSLELPEAWVERSIGDVAEFIRGVSYDKSVSRKEPASGFLPLLRATNIEDGQLVLDEFVYVPNGIVKESQILRLGDLVIAASSGSSSVVGKSAPITQEFDGTFGAFCGVLRPSNRISERYLAFFIQTPTVRDRWSSLARGTNINNLRAQHVCSTAIPLPSGEEQLEIVRILEEQFSRLDAAAAAIAAVRGKADQFRRSLLHAALTGALTHTGSRRMSTGLPADWMQVPLGKVVKPAYGKALEKALRKEAGRYPVVGSAGLMAYTDAALVEGEVLVVGRKGNVGQVHIFRDGVWPIDTVYYLKPPESLDVDYLFHLLVSREMERLDSSTTTPSLRREDLEAVTLRHPGLDEQREIVRILEEQLSRQEVSLAVTDEVERKVGALRRSLLHAAFSGELTKVWREKNSV